MISLDTQKRNVPGKDSKTLFLEGFLPAELYGNEIENMHLQISIVDFNNVLNEAGESSLVNLKVDKKEYPVLIQDVQRSPLGNIQHIDFYAVKMGEKMTAEVPFEFIGESSAVKEKGGVMITSFDSVEVETLPSLLPHKIKIDLSLLVEIGDSIQIKDVEFPKDVKSILEDDTVVVSVSEPKKQEEEVAEDESEEDIEALEADEDKEGEGEENSSE